MRTTLRVDDDVIEAARSLARIEGKSLGKVVSDLARKGLRPPLPSAKRRRGFPVFEVSQRARPITQEMVTRASEEE